MVEKTTGQIMIDLDRHGIGIRCERVGGFWECAVAFKPGAYEHVASSSTLVGALRTAHKVIMSRVTKGQNTEWERSLYRKPIRD